MKTIIANILRGWGKTPCYLLAAFFALAATGAWAATNITDNVTLTEDTDWSDQGVVTIEEGVTLDLNGYTLTVAGIDGTGSIVDSFAGYERIQYLQATGTQCINTGYVHNDNTKVDIRVLFDSVSKEWQCIYGARNGKDNAKKTRFSAWLNNAKFRRELGAAGQNIDSPTASKDVIYDIHLDKTGYFIVTPENGETFSKNANSSDDTSSGGALADGQTDFLFAVHELEKNKNYWTSNHWALAKLYSCKIYSGTTLKCDFVPVRSKSGNKDAGLLDLANNGTFHGNAGTGAFNAGATVSSGGLRLAPSSGEETVDFSELIVGDGVTLVFTGEKALDADLDATKFASVEVASGAVLDLAGHNLTVNAVEGDGTITDTVGTALSGYERLQYLQAKQSDGKQYIDTGYVHNDSTKVDIRIQIDHVGGWQGFYGARYFNGGEADRFSVWVHTTDECFCSELGTTRQDKKTYTVDTSKIYDIHLAKKGEESYVEADGVKVVSLGTGTATGGSFDEGRSDYLFALHQYYKDNTPNWYPNFHTKAKLYSCRIYSGTTLERDFVPAKRKSDNVLGLLDLANGKFYTNAGTGTFTAGPVVATTSGGELRIEVAEGETLSLADMAKITGTVKVVKTGAGTLVMSTAPQGYAGGTEVQGGTLKSGVAAACVFGAEGTTVAVGASGSVDFNGNANMQNYVYDFDDGAKAFNGGSAISSGVFTFTSFYTPVSTGAFTASLANGAALDLTEWNGSWPISNVTAPSGATVTVKVDMSNSTFKELAKSKDAETGESNGTLLSFGGERPANTAFVPDAASAGRCKFIEDANGDIILALKPGLLVIVW